MGPRPTLALRSRHMTPLAMWRIACNLAENQGELMGRSHPSGRHGIRLLPDRWVGALVLPALWAWEN